MTERRKTLYEDLPEYPLKKIPCGCVMRRYYNTEGAIVTERDYCKSCEANHNLAIEGRKYYIDADGKEVTP